jgi:hypothetical protein
VNTTFENMPLDPLEESKESKDEELKSSTPVEVDPSTVKFILFQSQNVSKGKTSKLDKFGTK